MKGGNIDEAAFIAAYDAYADAIFRYCYFRTYNRELSKELMQETFMKTWEYIRGGKEINNLRAFLYRTAHNLYVNDVRRAKSVSLEALQEAGGYEPYDESLISPEQKTEISLMLEKIEELDERSREILRLRYIEGFSVTEIAEMLDQPQNTTSVHIHRAIAELREKIQPKYE